MNKLDIKALKRQIPEARQKHMIDSFGNSVEGMVLLSADQAEAIIAALEDRERLRAALESLVAHVFDSDTEFEAALNEARAALEGRDG